MSQHTTDPPAGVAEQPRRRTEPLVVVAVAAAAVGLLYARAPFAARQLWAEDGREFLGDALRDGAVRSLGHSAAGYYLTVSRLGGVLASLVPLRAAAFVMWLWVAGVVAWLVATVTVSSRTWLTTWPARVVAGLSLVLLPVLGAESIANAANLQFLMLFACVVVLVAKPRSRIETINGAVVLAATGLTTPIAAALLPLVVLRMLARRSWRPDAFVVGWLVGVVVQLTAIAVTRPASEGRTGVSARVIADRLETDGFRENLLPTDVLRVPGSFFTIAFFLVLAGVVWLAWRQQERERAVVLVAVPVFGVGVLVVLAAMNGAANRYLVLTGLCLVWTVVAAAETVGAAIPKSWRVSPTVASAAVAAILAVTFVARWTPSEMRRSGSTWSESLDVAEAYCRDHPDGVARVRIAPVRAESPDQWSVRISCREVI